MGPLTGLQKHLTKRVKTFNPFDHSYFSRITGNYLTQVANALLENIGSRTLETNIYKNNKKL